MTTRTFPGSGTAIGGSSAETLPEQAKRAARRGWRTSRGRTARPREAALIIPPCPTALPAFRFRETGRVRNYVRQKRPGCRLPVTGVESERPVKLIALALSHVDPDARNSYSSSSSNFFFPLTSEPQETVRLLLPAPCSYNDCASF